MLAGDRPPYEAALWKSGERWVAGVDEAGRGPLAGPVVAVAVLFAPGRYPAGLDDSKKLAPEVREGLVPAILSHAAGVGVAVATPERIDRLNILRASLWAMAGAVRKLPLLPERLIVDGPYDLPLAGVVQEPVIGADGEAATVAAASILAKVTRDRLMVICDRTWPAYGFARHKGYPTREHLAALVSVGPCPLHRWSFAPVAAAAGSPRRPAHPA